jgi:putative membrane protein
MKAGPRKPMAFILDKATPTKTMTDRRTRKSATIIFDPPPNDDDLVTVPVSIDAGLPKRWPWGTVFISSILLLSALSLGLFVTSLVEDLYARQPWFGYVGLALAIVAGLAGAAIIIREIWGLLRLNRIEALQEKAARALNFDEPEAATAVLEGLQEIYRKRADMAWALAELAEHESDIIKPADRMRMAERILLEPLDEAAHKIIAKRARRVTLLTTVTPAATLDIIFVAAQNFAMLREIASLYGGRPSTLATMRLARMALTHLAIAGGLALSDNLMQHIIGKGLLGRLSARFGEGAINGIITSRIGLAAAQLCRPVPHSNSTKETLASLLRELVSWKGPKGEADATSRDLTKR